MVDHHGGTLFSYGPVVLGHAHIHAHAHVTITHQLLQDHTLAAVVLDNNIQVDLVTESVSCFINQLVYGLVMPALIGCLYVDAQFKEGIRSHLLRNLHVSDVKLLVASDPQQLTIGRDHDRTRVLKGVNIDDIVALFVHIITLK